MSAIFGEFCRVEYNIDDIPADHIVYVFVDKEQFPEYDSGVDNLQKLTTRGGIWMNNFKTTFEDETLPFIRINTETPLGDGDRAKASFIVQKLNLYTLAFTEKGEWQQFEYEGNYTFCSGTGKNKVFKYADFSLNYAKCGGLSVKEVGLQLFGYAIIRLHCGGGNTKRTVHDCCFYLSESPRFKAYKSCISKASDPDTYGYVQGVCEVPKNIRDIYLYWEKLSDCYVHHLFTLIENIPTVYKNMLEGMGVKKKLPLGVREFPTEMEDILSVLLYKFKPLDEKQLIGSVKLKNLTIKQWSNPDGEISEAALKLKRDQIWNDLTRRKLTADSKSDVWRTIKDIIEVAHEDLRIAKLILKNGRLRMMKKNMSLFEDEYGNEYQLPDEVLGDPTNLRRETA